jgi:hypothetical protein
MTAKLSRYQGAMYQPPGVADGCSVSEVSCDALENAEYVVAFTIVSDPFGVILIS